MPLIGPIEILETGLRILAEVMEPKGFAATPIRSGPSSGGQFAMSHFQRGDRSLELHVRRSLGLVTYRLGVAAISHEDYMWAVIGRQYGSHYPGFSEDPLDGFRGLRVDLEQYGKDFLAGHDAAFLGHIPIALALRTNSARLP